MDSRERVLTALAHQEPDQIPIDFGATVLTSIHHNSYKNLRAFLHLPEVTPTIWDAKQQIVAVEPDLMYYAGSDAVNAKPNLASSEQASIKNDPSGFTYFIDEWGIGWKKPAVGGFYYDMFLHPLAGGKTTSELKAYPWPDPVSPDRFAGLKANTRKIVEEDHKAVVLDCYCSGILEMASWLMGYEDFLTALATRSETLSWLLGWLVDQKIAYWEAALREVGKNVDVVAEADDMSGQTRMIFSPATYRSMVKPHHKRLLDFIHSHTGAKVFFHSCGAVRTIIPDLIEIGVDILNPVQVNAVGMDSAELKKEFGRELTFWGGGVDTQGVFGSSIADEKGVAEDVKRRIDDLAPGGGFIFATIHNIQSNVPPENIIAMWETYRKNARYGSFPLT